MKNSSKLKTPMEIESGLHQPLKKLQEVGEKHSKT